MSVKNKIKNNFSETIKKLNLLAHVEIFNNNPQKKLYKNLLGFR